MNSEPVNAYNNLMTLMHKFRAAKMDSEESSIRGHNIEYILRCVSRVDGHIKGTEGRGRAFSKYIKIKEWLVQEQYLSSFIIHSIFRDSKQKIPLFCLDSTIRGLAKGILLLVSGKRFIGETSAQAIRVKNNVRIFFTKGSNPFAVKMLISRHRSLENMKNEIVTRNKISGYGTVKIPGIMGSDLSFDPPFFQEEIVWGEKPIQGKDDSVISGALFPQIWSTYEKGGFEFRKVSEVMDIAEFSRGLNRSLDGMPWLERYGDKHAFLLRAGNLLKMDGLLPCGFVHGDLCLGNIIVTPDREVYLVDWEQAGKGPIVFDLYEFLTEFPESKQYLKTQISNLEQQDGSAELLPFHMQLCLAALTKIRKWSANYHIVTPRRLPGLKRRMLTTIRYVDELLAGEST